MHHRSSKSWPHSQPGCCLLALPTQLWQTVSNRPIRLCAWRTNASLQLMLPKAERTNLANIIKQALQQAETDAQTAPTAADDEPMDSSAQ